MLGLFGQGMEEFTRDLSKCLAYSDRAWRNLPGTCPNAWLIRTGHAGIYLGLVRMTGSFRQVRRNLPGPVQVTGSFGQGMQEFTCVLSE
jgi:hypothetical protein